MTINDGLLVIDKPTDWTSNDVVQKVKHLLGARRVGHAGTLDPAATGVLLLCLNKATKWFDALKMYDKRYSARITLGRATDTGDAEGETTEEVPVGEMTQDKIEAALAHFRGRINQQVPLYAAVKVKGKPLYRWAREKKVVERPWREIEIHDLTLKSWRRDTLAIDVACSKGTYIRALAEDIGRFLGYPAHLAALRRTAVGPFDLKRALGLEQFIQDVGAGRFELEKHLIVRPEAAKGLNRGSYKAFT